jgi:hypothetical protein
MSVEWMTLPVPARSIVWLAMVAVRGPWLSFVELSQVPTNTAALTSWDVTGVNVPDAKQLPWLVTEPDTSASGPDPSRSDGKQPAARSGSSSFG